MHRCVHGTCFMYECWVFERACKLYRCVHWFDVRMLNESTGNIGMHQLYKTCGHMLELIEVFGFAKSGYEMTNREHLHMQYSYKGETERLLCMCLTVVHWRRLNYKPFCGLLSTLKSRFILHNLMVSKGAVKQENSWHWCKSVNCSRSDGLCFEAEKNLVQQPLPYCCVSGHLCLSPRKLRPEAAPWKLCVS